MTEAAQAILAIDPGAGGGLAVQPPYGIVEAQPMPEGMTAQIDAIRAVAVMYPNIRAVIENVGFHRPGNSAVSTAKFARHVGHLEATLYNAGIPFVAVAPATWMKSLGSLPADKADRKRAIREQMARRFPHLSVTLKTADALGILTYAMRSN
jgi:hypothetical protein